MITTGLAATDRNAIILSEIQVQEFSVEWNRAALAQEGDYICPDGQPIRRTSLERTLARAETVLPILRAALEPEPTAPHAGLANLAAFLNLAPGSAEPLAELDPSDPVAVQVATLTARVAQLEEAAADHGDHIVHFLHTIPTLVERLAALAAQTERLATLERQHNAVDVLLRMQLREAEAAQTYEDTASSRDGHEHYQTWQAVRRQLETIADAYMRGAR